MRDYYTCEWGLTIDGYMWSEHGECTTGIYRAQSEDYIPWWKNTDERPVCVLEVGCHWGKTTTNPCAGEEILLLNHDLLNSRFEAESPSDTCRRILRAI